MSNLMSRFVGGPPIYVALRLAVISLVVGVVLSALNLSPLVLLEGLQNILIRVWEMGFEAIEDFGEYLLIGASVVIPIWLIMRVLAMSKRSRSHD